MAHLVGAVVLAAVLVLPVAQAPAHAQNADASLSYSAGYLITGNYVDGAVDLTSQANPPDADGFSTGTIHISGVPTDAEILAAYVFFEAITPTADLSQARVKFRGQEIDLDDKATAKKAPQDLNALNTAAPCWSSGTPLTMTHFRIDVLRLLPVRLDKNGKPTSKHVVNDADLNAHQLPLHTVSLPTRSGNQTPESAGASLVIVYRDPSEPLRKIVFYDGIFVQPSLTTPMTKTLRGFYLSSSTKSAKITHIIGSGQPNGNERVFFDDGPPNNTPPNKQVSAPDPIAGGSSSQRGWTDLTYNVSGRMNPGNNSAGGYGETATTTVDHSGGGGYDCLAWSAVIFSTAVKDTDPSNDPSNPGAPAGDGLPDGLEDAGGSGLLDADGEPLPNLNAMGASSSHRDLFIEVNAMWAAPGTHWGSLTAPYDSTHVSKTDLSGHHHRPTPADLRMMIDRYMAHGITPHFDVGDQAAYHALGVITHTDWVDDYASTEADAYLVPSNLARGGELVKERACDPASAACRFPDYPGVVGWKFGFQLLRDFPVRDDGSELTPQQITDPSSPGYFDWNNGEHRRRFDLKRRDLFHYVLYAHLLWKRKSPLPCLVNGLPAPYPENTTACPTGTDNPDFHVPSGTSGIADLPGNNAMVTLGRFDEFIGRPYVRAATAFHELGHNMNLWHGGLPTVWGNKALNTATFVEPNCKSFPTTMSYLYQMHGLYDNDDNIHIDYSGITGKQNDLTESAAPIDQGLFPVTDYRPAWYAPAGSALATSLGASAATRYCSGQKFDPTLPPPPAMARVYTSLNNDAVDWNGNNILDQALPSQDVNFDAKLSTTLFGFNDWANLRLQQLGAGRNKDLFHSASGSVVGLSGDDLDAIGDDVDAIGDDIDAIGDDLDAIGDDVDAIGDDVDAIGDDLDAIGDDVDAIGDQEIDVSTANALGKSVPYAVRTRIISDAATCTATFNPQCHARAFSWQSPTFGHVFLYRGSRKRGNANSTSPYVDIGTSSVTSFIEDTEPVPSPGAQLPDGVSFTYRFRAEFDDQTPHEFSGFSKSVTITAVNNAPVANADPNYTTPRNKTLTVTEAQGVLVNDTDVDSPRSFLRAVLKSGPANGTLTLNTNGSFTYTPKNGFVGVDTFKYVANNGMWADDTTVPLSPDSSPATGTVVTITVTPK
jgi:hypothetical protein